MIFFAKVVKNGKSESDGRFELTFKEKTASQNVTYSLSCWFFLGNKTFLYHFPTLIYVYIYTYIYVYIYILQSKSFLVEDWKSEDPISMA